MSNNSLWKELYSNKVYIKGDDIIIDELFQIVTGKINLLN
mgnify:CR=1 FL=1